MSLEIELDKPYEIMYDNLVEEAGKEAVDGDIKSIVQNALHESTIQNSSGME